MKDQACGNKNILRSELRFRLQNISSIQRKEFSTRACFILRRQPIWQKASSILFYASLANELDLSPLLAEALAEKKTVLSPRFNSETDSYIACEIKNLETDFLPGKFGILEPRGQCAPFSLNKLDLALVPGIGFDEFGGRLGRGRGFYDRLLTEITGTKCGVAFDEQLVKKIPVESHDIPMNFILTPTRWLETAVRPR